MEVWKSHRKSVSLQKNCKNMAQILKAYESNANETLEALWTLISSQPKRIKREISKRLQAEQKKCQKLSGIEQGLKDIKNGEISGPFNSAEELFEHLGI